MMVPSWYVKLNILNIDKKISRRLESSGEMSCLRAEMIQTLRFSKLKAVFVFLKDISSSNVSTVS